MPAKSEKQKCFMGAVMGAEKTGKGSPAALKAAKSMSKQQIKDFISAPVARKSKPKVSK